MEQNFLTIWDLVLTPFYLLILIFIAKRLRDKKYKPGHPLRKYYLPGLYVKFGGAIFIALIYQYYYKGAGDTFLYFSQSQIINTALDDSFDTWLKLILRSSWEENPEIYKYTSQMSFYSDPTTHAVTAIGAVLGLLNGTTYIPIALLFAYFSFTGIWAMYRTFGNLYPGVHKELAIAFLFIPSTFVWGSAIFKDTVCMFGLGWMTYTTFRIFINRDFSLRNIFLLIVSFYLIAVIKIYILLAFVPALCLWLLMTYSYRIRSVVVRWILNFLSIGIIAGGFFFFSNKFAEELNRYSLEKIAQTAEATRGWISYASGDEGSAYDLGKLDPTFTGMLLKFPQAVTVSLFRPFLWEVNKPIVALSALESFLFLLFTLKLIIFRSRLLKILFKDPNLLFFLIFSLIFAFAVGISSYNFGALSRYKIPCLPFFAALLVILLYKDKKKVVTKKSITGKQEHLQQEIRLT